MATGWIKISRDIQTHWIYQDSEKLKWWLDLLLLANFEDKEFIIKFKVFQCKRGQLLYSLKSLSQRWNVSKSVVNNFLELLRKQNMIETQNETVTTRITICNYDTYQSNENANETETKRKRNGNKTQCYTTKESKEHREDEEIKEEKYTCFSFDDFWGMYGKPREKKTCEQKYSNISELDREKIRQRLPIYILQTPDIKFRKDPIRYLTKEIWNDYTENVIQTKQQIKVNPYL